jgi:hypothetical protein
VRERGQWSKPYLVKNLERRGLRPRHPVEVRLQQEGVDASFQARRPVLVHLATGHIDPRRKEPAMRGFSRLIVVVILGVLSAGTLGGLILWPTLAQMLSH